MTSRYHPIEDGLWDDPKFDARPGEPDSPGNVRGFFAFLASNKMQRASGLYRATDEELAAAYRWPVKMVHTTIFDLCRRGLVVRDGAWIFLPGYLKRQAHNPSVLKSAQKNLESCSSSIICEAFAEHYPLYSSWCRHRADTVQTPIIKNDPSEQYQSSTRAVPEQSSNTCPRGLLPADAVWPSPESLALKYNQETPDECRSVIRMTDARKRKAKEYLAQFPDEAFWSGVFQQFHRSRFLRGLAQPTNGHKSFTADLDWLLCKGKDGSENAVKVSEGRYRD